MPHYHRHIIKHMDQISESGLGCYFSLRDLKWTDCHHSLSWTRYPEWAVPV